MKVEDSCRRAGTPKSHLDAGRINKLLAKKYNFGVDGIMSLGDYLGKLEPTYKVKTIRTRTRHKINLEYQELAKPVAEYSLWRERSGINVPKLVYDSFDLPESEEEAQ